VLEPGAGLLLVARSDREPPSPSDDCPRPERQLARRRVAESLHVDDGLWAVLEPLLPERVHQRIGRRRVDDRIAFTAILFVLVTGLPWRVLPREIGCSGVTAWRPLRDWQAAGVWDRLHREMLRRLNALGRLDWSTGVVDASHIRALRGGPLTGRSPVDRARAGSKHHLIVDRHGVPLAATLTGGHRNDVTQLLALIDGISAIAGKRRRPRQRPDRVIADRGYDHDKYGRKLCRRGVTPRIARRRTAACAGWWSGRSPGCTTSAGSASAGNATPPCTTHFCVSDAHSSAGGTSDHDARTRSAARMHRTR
jgi:transposase